jgi:predicted component of type VI protein secretion system
MLDGTGISREHLAIQSEEGGLYITDLSSNGTWVNGSRVAKGQKLRIKDGDLIELPGFEVKFGSPQNGGSPSVAAAQVESVSIQQPSAAAGTKAVGGSPLSFISNWLGSFTPMERFLAVIALASIVLSLSYLLG